MTEAIEWIFLGAALLLLLGPRYALMALAYLDKGETGPRSPDEPPVQGDPDAAVELIAGVLHRAHQRAEDLHAPNEARAIFHLTHSFADELDATNPGFDRVWFVSAVTKHS
jgi:hypothetical protein